MFDLMRFFKSGLFVLLMGFIFMACDDKQEAKEQENIAKEEKTPWEGSILDSDLSLENKLDALLDSINAYKQKAFASEQEKQGTTKLLVEEIEQSMQDYDPTTLQVVLDKQEELVAAMYSDNNLDDIAVMDAYDAKTAELMEELSAVVNSLDEFKKHARAKMLYKDITNADKSDFYIRKKYNDYVEEYNLLIEQHQEELEELAPSLKNLKPMRKFYGKGNDAS